VARIDADLVRESSNTTGTGALTVTGAITGENRFSSHCGVGDTFDYCIRAVDGSGVPTGEWEVGAGSYSATNTISRNAVYASSNGGALVNFSAGLKQVSMVFAAKRGSWVTEKLTAARTYYVRTDGSDSNDGLSDTAGGAFLTIQKAIDVAAAIDNNGFDITIAVGNGTFTGANSLKSFVGSGKIIIQGNADLVSTIVSVTNNNCFISIFGHSGIYKLNQLKLQTTTSGHCLRLSGPGVVHVGKVNFGAAAAGGSHIAAFDGALICLVDNYTISGGAVHHLHASAGIIARREAATITVTLTGTPAFSTSFAGAFSNATILMASSGTIFSGSATGPRYRAEYNAVINTFGGGTSYLPGNSAGTTLAGGQYG